MSMVLCAAFMGGPPKLQGDRLYDNSQDNIGLVPAYQKLYESTPDPILGYIHTDVSVHEDGWRERIEREFGDPKVAIVGMGGATGIGVRDIYKKRYDIWQLQRIDYYSNQTDWQVHGKLETGVRDVAVCDGFFLAVRRSFLDQIGGFTWFPYTFHCYDTCLCLMAHRLGYRVRIVGIECTHHGGVGSTTPEYKKWCEDRGTTMEREHRLPHEFLYSEFRDILPYRI